MISSFGSPRLATRSFRAASILLATGAMTLAAPGPAGAATEIGATFDPGTSFCGNLLLQSVSPPADSYAVPAAGVITSWSYQASETPVQIQLKVGRAAGVNQFTIVGESDVGTASSTGLNAFPARIPVLAGDVIGLRPVTIGAPCIRGMAPDYSYSAYVLGDDIPPGTTATFNPPVAGGQLDLAASLEPDVDVDAFGDETQDRCLPARGPMNGCPSNQFSFGKVKRDRDSGTAVLVVRVPGPGELTGTGTGVRVSGAARLSKKVGAAGKVKLRIKAQGKRKRELNMTGKVKVRPKITFTPAGGLPRTQLRKLTLRKDL